ncbi:glutathione S-transferase-like protein [Panaeolus papilionaceus]|nr:glutathione S-transferase-like protein [Panaeolus papilionaceus]
MVLKLYGSLTTNVTMVMFVLKEKEVEFERIDIDILAGEHKSPEHTDKHPFGQVPCIDDDGFILYEARAICQYIATKYATQGTPNLIPAADDIKAMALFQQAVSVEIHNFSRLSDVIAHERVTKPLYNMEYDQKIIDQTFKQLDEKMMVYDKILSKQRYLAGDTLTLADLFHVPSGELNIRCGWQSHQKYPNVARWWNEISSRPAWQEVHKQSKDIYNSVF